MIPWVADYGLLMYDLYISRDIEDKCFRYVTLNILGYNKPLLLFDEKCLFFNQNKQ